MSKRSPIRISSDRKRWLAAGNDHARSRSLNRYGNKCYIEAIRQHDEPWPATAALQIHPAMRASRRAESTVSGSDQVQSP